MPCGLYTLSVVTEFGLASVTMSRIAEKTGIRATLYKYFPDVDAILVAWHDRQVGHHLERPEQIRDGSAVAGEQLEAVLEAYALIAHESSKERRHSASSVPGRAAVDRLTLTRAGLRRPRR